MIEHKPDCLCNECKSERSRKRTKEMQLTICCQNCEKYPYCEDFQRWARTPQGARVTYHKTIMETCPTCGQATGEITESSVKQMAGIMLATCCENKNFVERVKK